MTFGVIFPISISLLPAIVRFLRFLFRQRHAFYRTLRTENIGNAESLTPQFAATFQQNIIDKPFLRLACQVIIGKSAGITQCVQRFHGFLQPSFTSQCFRSYQKHLGGTHHNDITGLVGTDAELAITQIAFAHPLEQLQTDIPRFENVLKMRVGHKTVIRIGSHHINIIEIITGVGLTHRLGMPPHPLGIGYVVKAHIRFGIRHQSISFSRLKCSPDGFIPLSGKQTGTCQQSVDNTYIRLELGFVVRTDIPFKKLLSLIQVFEYLRIYLFQGSLPFGLCRRGGRFRIKRNSRCGRVFQISKLVVLSQMQITESPQSVGLPLGMAEIGRIIITGRGNGNGGIAIVDSLVHQIPGKCGTVVGRHPHIVKLVG